MDSPIPQQVAFSDILHRYNLDTQSIVDPRTNTRSHSGVAYYEPAARRPNLHVLTEALVDKVLFERPQTAPLVARGVNFIANGRYHVVRAKEVILSAGAFESSIILKLSGISSPKILKENDILVLYENDMVGENLQDHALIPLGFEAAEGQITLDAFRDPKFLNAALAMYVNNHTGPLSSGPCSSALLSYEQILPASNKAKVPKGINSLLPPRQAATNPGLAHQYELTRSKTLAADEATAQELSIEAGTTPGEADVANYSAPRFQVHILRSVQFYNTPFHEDRCISRVRIPRSILASTRTILAQRLTWRSSPISC